MLGHSDGTLTGIDINDLSIVFQVVVAEGEQITSIFFEPSNLVFVTTDKNRLVAISLIKRNKNYMYVDLGQNNFATVEIPLKNSFSSRRDLHSSVNRNMINYDDR